MRETQRIITDKALLRTFEAQPGGLLSLDMMVEKTGLTKREALVRMQKFSFAGIVRAGVTSTVTKYFYELTTELEEVPDLELSSEPFLTVEDLQKIFVAYDYRVSPHDILMATELPYSVIAREMTYFRKEGVIEVVRIARPGDSPIQYILQEPYHPSENLDLSQVRRMDMELKEILFDEHLLV